MIIFDTDIASLFAKSDTIDLLFKILPNFSFAITVKIKEELSVPLQYGYSFPQEIFKQFITLVPDEEEYFSFEKFKICYPVLGKGELEAIAIAKKRKIIFATNDKKAFEIAIKEGIIAINTYTILKVSYEKMILDRSAISQLLKTFQEKDNIKLDIDKICI